MLTRVIILWVVTALAVFGLSRVLPEFSVQDFVTAFIVAVTLGFANVLIRPILFVLTLPISLVTFGLFSFVLNTAMLAFVAYIVPGFSISGLIPAFIASLVISAAGSLVHLALN